MDKTAEEKLNKLSRNKTASLDSANIPANSQNDAHSGQALFLPNSK